MRVIKLPTPSFPPVPFKAGDRIKVKRTVYLVTDVAETAIGIALVDLTKEKDGTPYFARWSQEFNAFLFTEKKAKNAGPTRLQALFEVSGK